MTVTLTVGMSEAKTHFSRLTADANRTGRSVVVFRNNKPWVEIRPLAYKENGGASAMTDQTQQAADQGEQTDQTDTLEASSQDTTYKTAKSQFSALGL